MKRALMIAVACLVIAGCGAQARRDLNKFWAGLDPDTKFKLVDQDGDGQPDTAIVVTDEGEPILLEDGTPKEVEGAREQFDNLKAADAADNVLGMELEGWAAVTGIPSLMALTGWIVRRKILRVMSDTVASVQTYRKTLSAGDKLKMNVALKVMSEETRHAVSLLKEAMKKDEA